MTDLKEQLKELIEQNDELENYFRNTIIPQLFVDADLILRKFTPPAMKQFSLSDKDLGKPIADIKDNLRFPAIVDNIQEVIAGNEILEKEIQTTDFRWFQMNIIPYVTYKDNKTNGVIITFVDITRRIKDLKEQETLIADYETLIDTISHDIKTPLTGLVLSIQQLKNTPPENVQRFKPLLNLIENSTRKLQSVIVELTNSGRQEQKYKAEEELLSFEHILEDVRLTLADSITAACGVIKSEINISEINFSRRKLRSVVYNLINNALKFKSPDRNPIVVVKTDKHDGYVVITIGDNGIGIADSKIKEIFLKYYRVENKIEGSGIGLYLVKEIVQNAGGKIEVVSRDGEGTEFKVYLKES